MKNNFIKILSSILFRNKYKPTKAIDTSYDKSKFREIAKTILGHTETKSINFDYQSSLKLIYSYNKIDLSNKQIDEKKETQAAKEKEILEMAEKESEKIYSNFFNDFSLKILENSNKENLLDLACKSFVGNTGVNYI